jgi:hypothetical protein
MTMNEQGFVVIRCSKCGKKLGEYSMRGDGEIRILCRQNFGKGLGRCDRLNIVNVRPVKNDNKTSKDADIIGLN